MEVKVILYIVIGIIYFLYTIGKRIEEKKKDSAAAPAEHTPPVSKPVSPPAVNPMEDILREIRRKQAEMEAQRKVTAPIPKPVQITTPKKPQKEILVREVKSARMGEGTSDYEPVFEREPTEEEKIHRGNIRLKNEGIYKVQTIEEAKAASDAERDYVFALNAREAFIGSIIFEKKF